MNTVRKQLARHSGLSVDYMTDVTDEQARKIDELVRCEFETGEWVTVEQESC